MNIQGAERNCRAGRDRTAARHRNITADDAVTSQRAAGAHADRTGEHVVDGQGSAVHRSRADGGVAVPHPRATRLDIERVEAREMIVDGAAALQDEFIGRAGKGAAHRIADQHRAGLQDQRAGAGSVKIDRVRSAGDRTRICYGAGADHIDPVDATADRRSRGIRHIGRAGLDARLGGQDRATTHIVHGDVVGEMALLSVPVARIMPALAVILTVWASMLREPFDRIVPAIALFTVTVSVAVIAPDSARGFDDAGIGGDIDGPSGDTVKLASDLTASRIRHRGCGPRANGNRTCRRCLDRTGIVTLARGRVYRCAVSTIGATYPRQELTVAVAVTAKGVDRVALAPRPYRAQLFNTVTEELLTAPPFALVATIRPAFVRSSHSRCCLRPNSDLTRPSRNS